MKFKFMENNSFEERQAETLRIRSRYPDRLPVIVEKMPNSDIPDIDQSKYLVPFDISFAQFMTVIRKRISLPSSKAMFCFVGRTIPSSSTTMGKLYQEHANVDRYLYISYSGENSFGHGEAV